MDYQAQEYPVHAHTQDTHEQLNEYNQATSYDRRSNTQHQTGGTDSVFPAFYSIKIHNKNAAFEIKPTRTQKGFITVNIEAARSIPGTSNPIKYNWPQKLIIQITKTELADLVMVLLGMSNTVECNNHNVGSVAKSISLAQQEDGVYVKLNKYDKNNNTNNQYITVKLPTNEALAAGHMALVQYCQNFPTLTTDSALKTFEYTIKRKTILKRKSSAQ